MGIQYDSLDDDVRGFMKQELEQDEATKTVYRGKYLTDDGFSKWVPLLMLAIEGHDDDWLATQLDQRGVNRIQYEKRKPKGGTTMAAVPHTASQTLAEGEFNRYYARGLCRDVLDKGGTEVEVYRGKPVSNPRSQSQALVGTRLSAQQLLTDLRKHKGVDTALGLPPGPNSGLTARRC